MSRRRGVPIVVISAMALGATACGVGSRQSDRADRSPSAVAPLRHGEVAADYARAMATRLEEGRSVVEELVAGRIAAVYERTIPELRAETSRPEVERLFAELRAGAPIGPRTQERAAPLGTDRGVYWADHAWGDGRLRFTVVFTPSGLAPSLEPVEELPVDPRGDRPARAELRLPFDGLWWVSEGPSPEIGQHHAAAPDQRHAFDFAIWRNGATYRGSGAVNADYWCWGQRVLAPAGAKVVAARDGIADNRPWVDTNATEAAGNHVMLDLGRGEYALLAHLQQGSVRVAAGDKVSPGEEVGRCGNSGNSTEPHIHFHVQDRPTFQQGGEVGVPVRFDQHLADGAPQARAIPSSGQFVSATEGGR